MTKPTQQHIEVHAHWKGLLLPVFMGVLQVTSSRGKEIFSFMYDHHWLKNNQENRLDPALMLVQGVQYAPQGQGNFGLFLDSSPDRWGRVLMRRREAQLAREEGRAERTLLESDYLLGVYDQHRMGALRFRTDPAGPFLDNNKAHASPPWGSMRELEQASLELEKKDAEKKPGYSKWLSMLIIPGASLGGARPKASIIDDHGHPWVAKFPSAHDDNDIGAWEMVVYKLAQKAGIDVPLAQVRQFNSRDHTFLSKRFDRTTAGERIHFASAMTLLQRKDGDDAAEGVSYLELAEFIIQNGSHPALDLEQLWRRIVFYICVSNVDDHLRNHGFLLDSNGWRLSPAYDMNPDPNGHGLKLNISESDNAQDLALARDVAPWFRVKSADAANIIQEVLHAVKTWPREANDLRISTGAQERMACAFGD
jgi:serine/threonine-protein kinase HipA